MQHTSGVVPCVYVNIVLQKCVGHLTHACVMYGTEVHRVSVTFCIAACFCGTTNID